MIYVFLIGIIIINEIIIKKKFLSDNIKFSKHKSLKTLIIKIFNFLKVGLLFGK